jgi:hypothetical protein
MLKLFQGKWLPIRVLYTQRHRMKPFKQRNINDLKLTKEQEAYYGANPSEEIWYNDKYVVHVRRGGKAFGWKDEKGNPILITHLSIRREDNRAIIDWRDFQWIKNELVGEENEGCEIYPAESRLVDGANQFHTWVFEDDTIRFPFGFNERIVSETSMFGETQRKFPIDRQPKDLKESEEKARNIKNNLNI